MPSERDALLAAVCANPEGDTPRLVFADWLQESGATTLLASPHLRNLAVLDLGNPVRGLNAKTPPARSAPRR